MNLQKGSQVFVKEQSGKRAISRAATVKEVVGRGAFVEFANNSTRMVLWNKLGITEKGPWGKKAFEAKKNGSSKKHKYDLNVVPPKPVSVNLLKGLTPAQKIAATLVGKVVQLDEENGAYVMITPELAAQWIDKSHDKNLRTLSTPTVELYQKAIEDGDWSARAAVPIMFDPDGYLVNGQHRLWAIALSGISIKMKVFFGVPHREVMVAVDAGKVRTDAQRLQIPKRYTSIINSIKRHATGNRDKRKASPGEMEKLVAHYTPYIEWFDSIESTPQGRQSTRMADIAGVIIRAKEHGENEEKLIAFVQLLRRDPLTTEFEPVTEQIFMTDKLAHFLNARPRGGGGEAVKDERVAKLEWVLMRFLRNIPFTRIMANQEKVWSSPLVHGNETGARSRK